MAEKVTSRTPTLGATAYKLRLKDMPKEFMKVSSYSQKCDWHHPKAED